MLRIFCLHCYKVQLNERLRVITELQLRLVTAGYLIEAEELELYKPETSNSDVMVKMENGPDIHPKVAEYYELLEREPVNQYAGNKNTEAVRHAIIANTLSECQTKTCIHCRQVMKRVKFSYKRLVFGLNKSDVKNFYQDKPENADKVKAANLPILANECREYLRKIWMSNASFLKLFFPILNNHQHSELHPTDSLFMDLIPVTPPNVRPVNKLRNETIEHPQSVLYKEIIRSNNLLRAILLVIKSHKLEKKDLTPDVSAMYDLATGNSANEKLLNAWNQLQLQVDMTLDVDLKRQQTKAQGLKQLMEKKEGLIRMHMMGKRVNYAARTVITPDPNIGVDEIGVPEAFALKLTYPSPVSSLNVQEMRRRVMNGPDQHPGACYVQTTHGRKDALHAGNKTKRETVAKTLITPSNSQRSELKIVHRHLQNGDILLLNRQPTLHRPSIMAHKARILKGEKTFRLHYSNCKSYNADFDGDEMNAHFVQNEVARSEGYNLANVANQYLVPKDGTPLGGLIQDHIIACVKLMTRGNFFNK